LLNNKTHIILFTIFNKFMARIICVGNQKGGIGKSSTTVWLAGAFSVDLHQRVLVLDFDSQQSIIKHRQLDIDSGNTEFPYEIIASSPDKIKELIEEHYDNYDVIFLDMPRMTGNDQLTIQVLMNCDSVLVPFIASQYDTVSTAEFIEVISKIGEVRKKRGFPFYVFGFINRRTRTAENDYIPQFAEEIGVKIFESYLADRVIFRRQTTYQSIMETKDGHDAFSPFLTEFIEKFEIEITE
jgi:chromosome partitioning protein